MTIQARILEILSNTEIRVYEASQKDNRRIFRDKLRQANRRNMADFRVILKQVFAYRYTDEPVKRTKASHDLWCSCRKCNPSINTYHRKLKSLH